MKNPSERLITRDVALVMVATFCFMASNMLATQLMAGFSESLGAAGAMMGIIAGMMNVVSLFCRPIAGNLADRASKRPLVGIGASLYLVSSVWYAFAGNTASLIAARMVNGVGFACCSVCLATRMSLLLPIRHMGAGMGLYGTMNALAMAIGPAIGTKGAAADRLPPHVPDFHGHGRADGGCRAVRQKRRASGRCEGRRCREAGCERGFKSHRSGEGWSYRRNGRDSPRSVGARRSRQR